MRKGIIKINPQRFCPVIIWQNGRLDWAGTKREKPSTTSFEITPSQQKWAVNNVNKEFIFEFDNKDYAKIIK
jgi:hypothetical protein